MNIWTQQMTQLGASLCARVLTGTYAGQYLCDNLFFGGPGFAEPLLGPGGELSFLYSGAGSTTGNFPYGFDVEPD